MRFHRGIRAESVGRVLSTPATGEVSPSTESLVDCLDSNATEPSTEVTLARRRSDERSPETTARKNGVTLSALPLLLLVEGCRTAAADVRRGKLPPLVHRLVFWAEPFILSIRNLAVLPLGFRLADYNRQTH